MRFGPASIHSQQHLRPVLSLGSATAGVDFQIGIIGIYFAGKQSFQFTMLNLCLKRRQLFQNIAYDRFVIFGLGQFCQIGQII